MIVAEPANTTGVGNADFVEESASLDLAEAGKRLEQREYLQLGDVLVRVGLGQRFLDGERTHLQPILDLGASGAGFSRLRQRGSTLLGCELWGCCHLGTLARCSVHERRSRVHGVCTFWVGGSSGSTWVVLELSDAD